MATAGLKNGQTLAFSAAVWYFSRTMQKFEAKVSEFIVVLKPSPFGPDPHFRQLRIEPQFDNVTAYFRSGHIELRFLQTPPVQIGDTITLHFEAEPPHRAE
jgi:hypothetical protein